MSTDFLSDPLWYKDAVIYELHVRSFYDANNDGFGDFEGLRRKLPFLESLGINTVWLLPFLESPLRDDGYDTADYFKILPVHGSMDDFKAFLDEAHARGMRVITELVLNHTSDQHPWFQEARDPRSPRHDWYVWSETTERYKDARIIFTDTEISNWTWDQKAGKYYWHRFFSHQPDLNYDNPVVRQAMKEVMFYWLDMGVDGLRLDAVPYLYEREGTNCENLPETIDYIVELREAIEHRYGPGRVLLAEANQWPEDTLPYFADGKGVQMAFNFPIMPRMYMALRREDRRPLVEMLRVTNDIPADTQWAIFLRNHDELTLEMVTDEERDYMYHEYAADARFRINVGIRRRLAPLLGSDRRRIELMNALLLSLKGSPILYYGDEIGMGDDPFLGDRNGVRTPMQWSPDKNGGFSRAPHHRLFMPAIAHGAYSYEFVNVEDAENNPSSLLHFTKRILAVRRQHEKVFGRGTLDILPVDNQSVLAFVREYEGRRILVLANLSHFAQSVLVPVDERLRGMQPVELFSQAPFPAMDGDSYHLPLGPHGFYWLVLQPADAVAGAGDELAAAAALDGEGGDGGNGSKLPVLRVREGLQNLLVRTMAQDKAMARLEVLLREYLPRQRWFGAREQAVKEVHLADAVRLQARPVPVYLSILRVSLGETLATYMLPLTLLADEDAAAVLDSRPHTALAWVETPEGRRLLVDATAHPRFWVTLFHWWQQGRKGRSLSGVYGASMDAAVRELHVGGARLVTGEQSNSAALLDDALFIKLYRRMEPGINPETELLGYLTGYGFKFIPRLHGRITFQRSGVEYVMGILQQALPVETDGWRYALEMMQRFLDRVAEMVPPEGRVEDERGLAHHGDPLPPWTEEVAPEMISLARVLGVRTAELHLALSRAEGPDLAPEPATAADTEDLIARVRRDVDETRRMLRETAADLGEAGALADAGAGAGATDPWAEALAHLDGLRAVAETRQKIRVHGDYHLGQVLRAEGELYLLDFEGEPARTMDERRQRDDALRDVAGMLRSLEYAALAAWQEHTEADPSLEVWTHQLVRWCEAVFLDAYFSLAEQGEFLLPRAQGEAFLWAYLFDKALYEVRYELNNRPSWVHLPLRGLQRLLDALHTEPAPAGESEG